MGTTAEKGAYIIETKSLLKDKINNLGGSIDDNTTFRNYANQLQNVYDNLPKTEYQEGTEVNLGKTTKGKLDYEDNIVGYGQSGQDTTTGKNKFGFEVNTTDVTTTYRPQTTQRLSMTKIGLNEVKFNYTGGSYSRGYFEINGIDGTQSWDISFDVKQNTTNYTPSYVIDTQYSTNTKLIFYISGGNGASSVASTEYFVLQDIMVSVSGGDYEQYTGGQASPNPSYPQTINSVTGNQDVVVSGKNLTNVPNFNFETRGMTNVANNQVINSSGTPAGSWFNISPADDRISQVLKANTKYVFWRNQDLSLPLTARFYYADSTYLNVTISANAHYATFTPTQDTVNYYLYVGSGATADVPLTISNLKIMIYKGETDSANWEPYITPTSYQLSLGEYEFSGIGNYKDELVTDRSTGKWYKHSVIGKVIFNGTENWSRTTYNNTYSYWLRSVNLDNVKLAKHKKLCNYFTYNGTNYEEAPAPSLTENKAETTANNFMILFKTNGSQGTSIEEWEQWVSTHNLVVNYLLATPTLTEITDTTLISQLEAWYNAQSINGTTIITSNGNLPMIIKVRGLKGAA